MMAKRKAEIKMHGRLAGWSRTRRATIFNTTRITWILVPLKP
jgi:hypothetical protein